MTDPAPSADRPVYLDHAATTPLAPEVVAAMHEVLAGDALYANASAAGHAPGRRALAAVEDARTRVAAVIGADPAAIVWTSGATESDNLALLGTARRSGWRGRHVVTSRSEHRAVIDACRVLEREGFDVTWLDPDDAGAVSPAQLADALRDDTLLVSLMHVNNETGAVSDLAALGAVCRDAGTLFHVDAAQGVGKLALDVGSLPVDLVSLNAHKVHGPKGVGALWVGERARVRLGPLFHGGGQEQGLRPGTLATHQLVGMAAALELAAGHREAEHARIARLRVRLWQGLEALGGVHANSPLERGSPWILNVAFDGVDGESLRASVPTLALSSGSACNSAHAEPSYVLKGLGRSDQLAGASLRFSFGITTTDDDIGFAIAALAQALPRLRAMWPSGLSPGDGRGLSTAGDMG